MQHFPDFMKNPLNKVPSAQQNTDDIVGSFYEGADGSQAAFWECHADRESKTHTHPFDEYMVCVSGEYIAYVDGKETILGPGDELFIPKGAEQWGKSKAGTRTIHVFGGRRIVNDK
jgi:quercetin dioxygenase-like cupin family protein